MGTYLKNVMLFQSVTSNRMIECYTHWELNEKKVVVKTIKSKYTHRGYN